MADTISEHTVDLPHVEETEANDGRIKNMYLESFHRSEKILLLLGLVAIAVDPLFFYVPIMRTENNSSCLGLDKKLIIVAVIMRTLVDILHDWSWWFKSCTSEHADPKKEGAGKNLYLRTYVNRLLNVLKWQRNNHQSTRPSRRSKIDKTSCTGGIRSRVASLLNGISCIPSRVASSLKGSKKGKLTAPNGRSTLPARVIAILASMPFPQVVVFAIDLQFHLKAWIKIGVVCQFIPRIFRIYPTYVAVTTNSVRYAWIGAAFNLLLFVLASHALGGFWYLRAVERKMDCMKQACKKHLGCNTSSLYCQSGNHADNGFINYFCGVQPTSSDAPPPFDYGMNSDAIKSNLIGPMNFIKKLANGFWWGIKNLSSMASNIEFSDYIWDTCFAIFICILGLILVALLIGNLQTYLQSKLPTTLEKLKQRREELDRWAPFTILPQSLRREVSMCRHSKWQEASEVDLESLLNNTPWDLRRKLRPHFCENLFHKVKEFEALEETMKNELRVLARPVVFPARTYIFQEGYPICEMIHIVQGSVLMHNKNDVMEGLPANELKKNDFFGEKLLQQALKSPLPKLPLATETIQSVTKVEAFALSFGDFSRTFTKYGRHMEAYKKEWAALSITNFIRKKVIIEKRKKSSQERNGRSLTRKKSLHSVHVAPEPSSSES